MSASSKKKLRAEENAAKLTEKQIAQNKEDRKTRLYTIGFAYKAAVLLTKILPARALNWLIGKIYAS